jgi:hypothetical protein
MKKKVLWMWLMMLWLIQNLFEHFFQDYIRRAAKPPLFLLVGCSCFEGMGFEQTNNYLLSWKRRGLAVQPSFYILSLSEGAKTIADLSSVAALVANDSTVN